MIDGPDEAIPIAESIPCLANYPYGRQSAKDALCGVEFHRLLVFFTTDTLTPAFEGEDRCALTAVVGDYPHAKTQAVDPLSCNGIVPIYD